MDGILPTRREMEFIRNKKNKSEQFYVVINGHQNVKSDIYSIKASSICLYSYQE